MEVTFTKAAGRRYVITVVRERGPQLAPRYGPGYDDYLPHDAVHFVVEAEARLSGGVFGQIAVGRNNMFWPADPRVQRRQARREAKRASTAAERAADTGRSEELAGLCQPLWELRAGHRRTLPLWFSSVMPGTLESPLIERILGRLDEFAARWHALQIGGVSPCRGRWTRGLQGAGRPAAALTAVTSAARPRERCTHGGYARSPTGPTLRDGHVGPKPPSWQPQAPSPWSTRKRRVTQIGGTIRPAGPSHQREPRSQYGRQ